MRAVTITLALASFAAGCAAATPQTRAAALDRRFGTSAFAWIVDHDPSRLDVYGLPLDAVAPLDPGATLREAGPDLKTACRLAKDDRALLFAFLGASSGGARAVALDCGFAVERDAHSLVLAPR